MADVTRGAWTLLRTIDPIADDADWAATQDVAAAKAAGTLGVDGDVPRLGVFSVRLEWYDANNDKVAGRGSFDIQPIEITRQVNPVTGTGTVETVTDATATAATGYTRYDLPGTDGSQGFTVRLNNIVPPGGATKAVVYLMVN